MDVVSSSSNINTRQNEIGGFADYSREEHVLFSLWKRTVAEVYDLYGFMRFESRKVEKVENLTKKGEGGLDRELWAISHYKGGSVVDSSESTLCLPFDRTVPMALWIAKNVNIPLPLKRQDIDYSWRVENPQAGRFRAFVQADVDICDRNLNLTAESECIRAILDALIRIKVNEFIMYVNHIGVAKKLIAVLELSEDKSGAALRAVDKFEKIGAEGVTKELIEICGASKTAQIQELVKIFAFKGSVAEFKAKFGHNPLITQDIQKYIDEVYLLVNLISAQGVDPSILCFNPGMVRGLDYYTGVVFETFLKKAPLRGSIASGGRYDNLVDTVSENKSAEKIQGFGGTIGLTRLFDVCLRENMINPSAGTAAKVLICSRKVNQGTADSSSGNTVSDLLVVASTLAGRLRALNIPVDLYTNPDANIKKQLAYANSLQHPNVIMVLEKTNLVVKNMIAETQKEVPTIDAAVDIIQQNIRIQQATEMLKEYPDAINPSGKNLNAPKTSSAQQ